MKRAALLLLAAGCSSSPPSGALLALVDFGPNTSARCIEVVVRTESGSEVRSKPVVTDRTHPMKVGIGQGTLPEKVIVYAVGFSDDACTSSTAPIERTEDGEGVFKLGRTSTVQLTLVRRPNAVDADVDGYASLLSGGDDCDDTDVSVHPGALEACGNGKDDDCDRATDCEEAQCANAVCSPLPGARCKSSRCFEELCADGVDNDRDGTRDCADTDCDGAACLNGGTCQGKACKGVTTEKDLCDDGADNDGDTFTDCADPDCQGSLCTIGNACLLQMRCDAAKACTGGVPVACTLPGNACLQSIGACNPSDGGCSYAPDPGKGCDDSNGCTGNDTCTDAGTCVGAPMGCVAPAGCLRAAGCSVDGGCTFVAALGDACDDTDPCTRSDSCLADAGCGGISLVCAPAACQVFAGACSADAGCLFNPKDAGTACDGGVCNANGTCVQGFPYLPSNFTESELPTPGGPTRLNCTVTLDSNLADGGVGFGGWCGATLPPWRLIAQPGFRDAVLLAFSDLDLAPDASVRIQGNRPVIFAATGTLAVQGELLTAAGGSSCLDGGVGGGLSGSRGGGGGGFGSVGAAGGNDGGVAGAVNGEPRLVPLRGGCPAGDGARGGGAVQLSAAKNLLITGVISASGRGGPGGNAGGNGGQGAGSGGGVLLEGLSVLTGPSSAVTVNGGAAGEGGGLFIGGADGPNGSFNTASPAIGPDTLAIGTKGGDGAAGTTAASRGADGNGVATGGGGAGLGRVRINTATDCSLGGLLSGIASSNKPDAGCP